MDAQGGLCSICEKCMAGAKPWPYAPTKEPPGAIFNDDYVSFDHVIPDSKGGPVGGNILLAHPSCNILKDNKMPSVSQLAMLARVNVIFGWNGRYYENTEARQKMMIRRKFRGKEHHDYRDDPRYINRGINTGCET